ncbi:MAG: MoaD family protein [Candidatus Bathyarchaeota archaeon]|nr:MoaD family protein [Candidatus Bathyarchaeota archaeon]MDH5745987.1 MoaD family protein [Candidatus Bathyarchaeota archaeon]
MSVRFFAALRELVGKKVESLEFLNGEEATVERVLKRLVELYGKDFIEYVFDRETGDIQSYLTLLVNGRSITTLDGLRTRLTDGDVLAILPPVGGG